MELYRICWPWADLIFDLLKVFPVSLSSFFCLINKLNSSALETKDEKWNA